MLKNIWMAVGFVLYLGLAVLLPITIPYLGIFSDAPASWVRLAVPLVLVPFLMGYAQALFPLPWRVQLWSPAIIMFLISVLSVIDGVKNHQFLEQDLIFWPLLISCYLLFSWLGLRVRLKLPNTSS